VYEVNVSPAFGSWGTKEHEPKPYRYIDPEYRVSHSTEAEDRNVDFNQAWDDVMWVDLETEEDFIDKASKMFVGESFDTRVSVPLDLDNETILTLSMEAHKRDITLNQMVEELLREMIVNKTLS
jgi:macrodomain Ter protein organizer (MatP/YcbG family)